MKLVNVIISVVCSTAVFMACKKSDNSSPVAKKLQAGKWQISASTVTINYKGKDTTMDLYSGWRPCEQDDLIYFESGGKGGQNENTNKCPEDNQSGQFSWELQNNDTRLKITITGVFQSTNSNTITSEILEITDTHLKLKYMDTVNSTPGIIIETHKNVK